MRRLAVLAAGAVLTLMGCSVAADPDPSPSDGATAQGSAAAVDRREPVILRCPQQQLEKTVRVGPILRLSDELSVLPVSASGDNAVSLDQELSAGYGAWAPGWNAVGGPYGVRLLDLNAGQVREVIGVMNNFSIRTEPNEWREHAAFYGPVPGDKYAVLVPLCGMAFDVPVVKTPDKEIKEHWLKMAADSAAGLRPELGAPAQLDTFITAADDAVEVRTQGTRVEVSFSADTLFAYNSAEISGAAESRLKEISEQLKGLGGGRITITGHTDDIGEDQYNLELSKRRADAVWARLSAASDLSPFQVEVTGVGKSQPRVNGQSAEAREANRRVEVVAVATKVTAPLGASSQVRDSDGPTGTAAAGTTLSEKGERLMDVRLPEVRRVGHFLVGTVRLKAHSRILVLGSHFSPRRFIKANARGEDVEYQVWSTDGLTLLQDGRRIHAADYASAYESGSHRPLTELDATRVLEAGDEVTMTTIWPDLGGDHVVLDQQSDPHGVHNLPFRITGIPVVT